MPHRNQKVVISTRKSESPPPEPLRSIFAGEESGKALKLVDSDELLLSHFRHCCAFNGLSQGGDSNLASTGNGSTASSQNHHHPQQDHVVSEAGEGNGRIRRREGEPMVNGRSHQMSGKKLIVDDERTDDSSGGSDCGKLIHHLVQHDLNKDLVDAEAEMDRPKKIYKVVLTGGPCGGKTTGQARLCTFFENLGWKVFRVPEAATILLSGGIKFGELTEEQALLFQEHLLRTMMQIETVFFKMAETVNRDVLIICDRGAMDASAFIQRSKWEGILNRNGWNEVELRDTRYNHILHMVSAANGAEPFYTIEDHTCRSESLGLARELDRKAAQAWVGHPYFDVVDNSSDFETKLCRMIHCVCQKLGIDTRDRLQTNSKKVKYLVSGPLPEDSAFPVGFQDFGVVHDYLQTSSPKTQARLRKRGQKGNWSYTYTVRRPELQGQIVEVKTALTQRDYNNMLAQRDHDHVTVYKKRRCFLINDQYFQLDVYEDPCHPRCKGMLLLETYSTLSGTELEQRLPSFLNIQTEVTGDPRYSMFNLSLKERWLNNKKFCQSLCGSEDGDVEVSKNEARLAVWENAK